MEINFKNEIKIAGVIRSMTVKEDRAFFLVQWSPETDEKWIPCTIFKNKEALTRVSYFREGDYIQITGFARPWSQKKNNEWVNNVDVRVNVIHNRPAERPAAPPPPPQTAQQYSGDDIPF